MTQLLDKKNFNSEAQKSRTSENLLEVAPYLDNIRKYDRELMAHFANAVKVNGNLSRKLVSFQANKKLPYLRWYKFKEAFSVDLVRYFLIEYKATKGKLLDPFAGSGTSLFAAEELGYEPQGIELLPLGQSIIEVKKKILDGINTDDIDIICAWKNNLPWRKVINFEKLPTLRITKGAYPTETEQEICKYITAISKENENVKALLMFALLCVLESISFTRKDGQYLRWDRRSGKRGRKNNFEKATIVPFEKAITQKLEEIIYDLTHKGQRTFDFNTDIPERKWRVDLFCGSCLDILPKLENENYTSIFTSPPYCNRYDYTRTYALEHAVLGISEEGLSNLRQKLVSCTVENREKQLLHMNKNWNTALKACEKCSLLEGVNNYLHLMKTKKALNNDGIPRMVKGYFSEMACVIQECHRILKRNGLMFMVNDNVRYAGISISVDTILSFIAEELGFVVENIFVLPNGKGNSSQQMGFHGKETLRKCVYVWRKEN